MTSSGSPSTTVQVAASRENPIPVFAEMGSLNPVFVTEQALESRAEAIADGLVGSITLGTGQFCTKPGLVFIPPNWMERFSRLVVERLASIGPAPMLTPAIREAFVARVDGSASLEGVSQVVVPDPDVVEGISCAPALLSTDLDRFLSHDELIEEHFGPMTLLVATPRNRIDDAIAGVPGSLTVTVHGEQADIDELGETYRDLTQIAGRVIWNGFPTGVAVVPSMHHGGPYPSTTNSQHTSVGMTAVRRFLRPVAFQGSPTELLPPGLRDENPWGLRRLVDWTWE